MERPLQPPPEDALPARRERERAVDLALKAVARRERTVSQLRSVLERKRVEPEAIEGAVEELKASGLLDDARYAQRFADDKRALERWGAERIARDLRKRGIAPEHVERAVAGQDRKAEVDAALELLRARFPQLPVDDRERDRAWRLLIRRGYEHELAYEAVRAHSQAAEVRRAA